MVLASPVVVRAGWRRPSNHSTRLWPWRPARPTPTAISAWHSCTSALGRGGRELRQAVEADPDHPTALAGLGYLSVYSRQFAELAAECRSVVRIRPACVVAHLRLAEALFTLASSKKRRLASKPQSSFPLSLPRHTSASGS